MLNVTNNPNIYTKMSSLERENLPEISHKMLNDCKDFAPIWQTPSHENLQLRSRVNHVSKLDKIIADAKENSSFHKKLSLALLAASVAIIATTIIVASVAANPVAAILIGTFACLITAFIADQQSMSFKEYQGSPCQFVVPVLLEIINICVVFSGTKHLEKRREEHIQDLQTAVGNLRILLKHKPAIVDGIQKELEKVDVLNVDTTFDPLRIQDLRVIMRELEKADALLNMLDTIECDQDK